MAGVGLIDGAGNEITTIEAMPLSAAEYQVLKSDPELRSLTTEQDRTEYMGLRMCYEMMAKCDSSLSWKKFRQLSLPLLGKIAERVIAAVGQPDGGGVLGEA